MCCQRATVRRGANARGSKHALLQCVRPRSDVPGAHAPLQPAHALGQSLFAQLAGRLPSTPASRALSQGNITLRHRGSGRRLEVRAGPGASVEGTQKIRCAWQGAGKLSMTASFCWPPLRGGFRRAGAASPSSKSSIIAALAITQQAAQHRCTGVGVGGQDAMCSGAEKVRWERGGTQVGGRAGRT